MSSVKEERRMSYTNFVMGLAHNKVSVPLWWSIGGQNPKVCGSIPNGGLRIFCFSNARDKTKNIFLHFFFTDLKLSIFLILFNMISTVVLLLRK